MVMALLGWWYGPGWRKIALAAYVWPQSISRAFSLRILAGTLFSPWRQITTTGGRSIDDKMKAGIDNMVSRFIGLLVRLLVLIYAVVLGVLGAVAGAAGAIIWPLVPLLAIWCLYKGLAG